MSLAMSAAPFNSDNDNNNNGHSTINMKRGAHNRTQKKFPDQIIDTEKVNQVLQSIHNTPGNNDDDSHDLGEFNPPAPPMSSGVQRTKETQSQNPNPNPVSNSRSKEGMQALGRQPAPAQEYGEERYQLNNYQSNYGNKITTDEYYKRFVPNYDAKVVEGISEPVNKSYYGSSSSQSSQSSASASYQPIEKDVLYEKLNYMIHLLEEQQDERTGSVTEEVILYSFLGIFIIFMADSFSRIGKYTR